ncbi:MAG: chloride channel protein [Rhodospirillales bacterium]|nr:chloride channel protein [Rhodospirillales bacterium]
MDATRARHAGAAAGGDFSTRPRVILLAAMAVPVGLCGVGSAWVLLRLIALVNGVAYYGTLSTAHGILISLDRLGPWSILVPVAGSLLVGLMARFGSDKIRGHGIPEALEAILIGQSRIEPLVALLKPLSSAIAIGTGGPFGAEGPIIMTGGALGSLFAQFFHLTSAERKTLLVAGASAGMTAVFNTPIAAVLLAVELLLFEWKPRSFLPVVVACMTAAVTRGLVLPVGLLFPHHGTLPLDPLTELACAGVGVMCGALSGVLTTMVYAVEDGFQKLNLHWMWWPLLGGLVVGLGGLVDPRALGVGYVDIAALLGGTVAPAEVVRLMLVKAVIWAAALGSGTSGGVVAPLLIVGSCAGALIGTVMAHGSIGDWALIGMAATMGGTMRIPLTAALFAIELTGDSTLSVPLLTACGASFAFTVLVLRRSILTEKIARRGRAIMCEYSVDPLALSLVSDVMVSPVETLPATMTVSEMLTFFTASAPRHKAYPLLDGEGRPIAMVSRADALNVLGHHASGGLGRQAVPLAEALGGRAVVTAFPDEAVASLVDRMVEHDLSRVPVVRPVDGKLVGLVARKDLLAVRARLLEEERGRQVFLGVRVRRRGVVAREAATGDAAPVTAQAGR